MSLTKKPFVLADNYFLAIMSNTGKDYKEANNKLKGTDRVQNGYIIAVKTMPSYFLGWSGSIRGWDLQELSEDEVLETINKPGWEALNPKAW